MSKRRGNLFSDIADAVGGFIERVFGGGSAIEPPPEPTPEVIPVDVVTNADLLTEEEFPEEFEEEFEDYEEEEEFEEDEFESYLREIEEEEEEAERGYEVRTFREFIRGGGEVGRLRKVRYVSYEEAAEFLSSAGIAGFTEILFDEQSDTFGIAVYDSPGATQR